MDAVYTFIACFGLVFALAFQSLNTNQGRHGWAFVTSFIIGAAQLYMLRTIPSTEAWQVQAAYLAGGPFGALCAMRWHPWITRRRKTKTAFETAAQQGDSLSSLIRSTISDFKKSERRSGANINCGADRP